MRAVRVVAERTVEERILEVQKQKRLIIEGALSKKSRVALRRGMSFFSLEVKSFKRCDWR